MTLNSVKGSVIEEIQRTLRYMAQKGCRGFDCSHQSLEIIQSWAMPRRRTLPSSLLGKAASSVFQAATLEDLYNEVRNCRRCRLYQHRQSVVFGAGNHRARLMFVGVSPAIEDDSQGHPFVGPDGELLTKIIQAMKLTREEVYLCHLVKCRPVQNPRPLPDEIKTCLLILERQIELIKPDFICALGDMSAQTLLNTHSPISELRGTFHHYKGIRLMPTYHPEYLLRCPEKKREVWEDIKKLMKEYG